MNKLRRIHLYLGCFFAPMLVFFCLSGLWQVYGFQRQSKLLRLLSSIHTGQGIKSAGAAHDLSSPLLQIFTALMAVSLLATIILGIIMAFRFGHRTLALTSLAAGIVIPSVLILIFAT